jgi:phosphoglycolate phosphatase
MSLATAPLRAVVFDLDGTLVDSAPDLIGALDSLLEAHGRAAVGLAAGRTMIGEGAARLVERGFAVRGGLDRPLEDLVPQFVALYEERLVRLTRPFPGAVQTLATLAERGLALGLCTNKPDRATRRILDALGIGGFFASVVGGDGVRKPAADPVLRCVAGLGVRPAEALFVGDSPVDHAASRAAGVRVALVSFGYTPVPAREIGADHVVDALPELVALVTGAGSAAGTDIP